MAIQNFPTGAQAGSEKTLFSGQGFGEAQVFQPDYEGLLALKNKPIIQKENKRNELLGSISGLKGAFPAQAEELQKQKKSFWDKVNEGVAQNRHLDPTWLQQIQGEADFLKEAYADSNNRLNEFNKTQQEMISNPRDFTEESHKIMTDLLNPETLSQFQGNIPASSLYIQQQLSKIKKKPETPKVKSWRENTEYIKTQAPVKEVFYKDKEGNRRADLVIDYDRLNSIQESTFNLLDPLQQYEMTYEFGGDKTKLFEWQKQNLIRNAGENLYKGKMLDSPKDKDDLYFGYGGGNKFKKNEWSGSRSQILDKEGNPTNNYIHRLQYKGNIEPVFINVDDEKGKKEQVKAELSGYEYNDNEKTWKAVYKYKVPKGVKYFPDSDLEEKVYEEKEAKITYAENKDFADIYTKSKRMTGAGVKDLPQLFDEVMEKEGIDIKKENSAPKYPIPGKK